MALSKLKYNTPVELKKSNTLGGLHKAVFRTTVNQGMILLDILKCPKGLTVNLSQNSKYHLNFEVDSHSYTAEVKYVSKRMHKGVYLPMFKVIGSVKPTVRRITERVSCHVPIKGVNICKDTMDTLGKITGYLKDISSHGGLLMSDSQLKIGSYFFFSIETDGSEEVINIESTVLNQRVVGGNNMYGLKFTDIDVDYSVYRDTTFKDSKDIL